MSTFRHCFGATTRLLVWPLLTSVVVTCVCLVVVQSRALTEEDHFAGLWLHLPGFLLAATVLGATLEVWPLFSRAREGQGHLVRLVRGPFSGCGVATAAGLLSLMVALLLSGMIFQGTLHQLGLHHRAVHAWVRFAPVEGSAGNLLSHSQRALQFRPGRDQAVRSLTLRPRGRTLSSDFDPARIRVLEGSTPLHDGVLSFGGDPLSLVVTPPRALTQITIEWAGDPTSASLVLEFTKDGVQGISQRTYGELANCLLAIVSYLLPTALALAVMAVGRAHLALPVGFAAGLITLLLTTLLELTPNIAAMRAFARGRWILAEELAGAVATTLAAVGLVLLLAYLVGKLKN